MLSHISDEQPMSSSFDTAELKNQVHKAAQDGNAGHISELLSNIEKAVINEILEHVTEEDEQKTTPLVIAAKLGKAQVVEVLIQDFGVNIEQKSTVKFDGFVIQDATALWCAAGAGHMEVVKFLVRNEADVNNATASNSTPLRAACFDGSLDIVKYLLQHRADLTIPNKFNNTCLMISSYKGHTDVVRHLLEMGADPNVKAHCGATSIHFAADCGHVGVVIALIDFKASMTTNSDGMTPVMIAAECGRPVIVTYLVEHTICTLPEQIQAMELLGAAFANNKNLYNLGLTYEYLSRAMQLKCAHNLIATVQPNPPIKAYGYYKECQSIMELKAIKFNDDALHMEALIIRERILGTQNPEVPQAIIYRGAVFADSAQFDRCISLWIHALVLRLKNSKPIGKDLLRLAQVFSQMVISKAEELSFDDIETVLEHGIQDLKNCHGVKLYCDSSENLFHVNRKEEMDAGDIYYNNVLSVIYLIAVVLNITVSGDETLRFRKLVYQFLKLKSSYSDRYSPLHIVIDPKINIDNFHVDKIVSFPSLSLVSLFLTCGADIHATDLAGNTPLHIASLFHMSNSRQEKVRRQIIYLLLQNGAHCDIANDARLTPLTAPGGPAILSIRNNRCLSLQCLAARCIKDNEVGYHRSDIPDSLRAFVDWH